MESSHIRQVNSSHVLVVLKNRYRSWDCNCAALASPSALVVVVVATIIGQTVHYAAVAPAGQSSIRAILAIIFFSIRMEHLQSKNLGEITEMVPIPKIITKMVPILKIFTKQVPMTISLNIL
jgi:hypothetical protein